MAYPLQTCTFVSLSNLLHHHNLSSIDQAEFWCLISDNAPFSWGDNNRTLVTASSLANHCQDRLDDRPSYLNLLQSLRELGETYVDLES